MDQKHHHTDTNDWLQPMLLHQLSNLVNTQCASALNNYAIGSLSQKMSIMLQARLNSSNGSIDQISPHFAINCVMWFALWLG